jgi:DHA2 family multidrug resistance protein
MPVVNLKMFNEKTFTSATVIAFVMYGMLMGSMFLLPVFAQESLHYTATLSGIVLMPRTLAMMAVSPIVGKLYNKIQPAFIVGAGVVLFAIGSWQLSDITLDTSATKLIMPLVITGAGFACLFVPLTTAALSRTPRALMADAAGLNSFVRQIGGSIGLTIFATMFTNYAVDARAGVARNLTALRPEVVMHLAAVKAGLISHGVNAMTASADAGRAIAMSWYQQGTVLSFDRVFMLQGLLFLGVIPLLFFLRVPRTFEAEHLEIAME